MILELTGEAFLGVATPSADSTGAWMDEERGKGRTRAS